MALVTATEKLLEPSVGTNIGDLTGGGGLAAGFDRALAPQAVAASASKASSTTVYIGQTLASGLHSVSRADTVGTSDTGYVTAANPNIDLTLFGKRGAAPSTAADGTSIATLTTFADTANEGSTIRSIPVTSGAIEGWNHTWVRVVQSGGAATMAVSEVYLWESWVPPDPDNRFLGYTADNPILYYDNLITTATITASSEDADFPATNLANPQTFSVWKAANTSSCTLTIDSSGATTVDYVAIARHNFGTEDVTVLVEQRDGTNPYFKTVDQFTPSNDDVIIIRFPSDDRDNIRITLGAATTNPAQAAVVYCGQSTTLQRRVYVGHTPITYGRSTTTVSNKSESGNFLGRIILASKFATGFEQSNLSPAWYRSTLAPFVEDASENPFFFAWRPSSYPNEVGYCWLTNDPIVSNQRSNGMMSIGFDMEGIIE